MRVNIADEAHVQIKFAFPVAYDFIDDAMTNNGAIRLKRIDSLSLHKPPSETKSPYVGKLEMQTTENLIQERMKDNLAPFNLDGQEIDFKTFKKAPKTKMTNLTAYTIEKALEALNLNNKNKIFIHCAMGRSRSASCVIMYIMKKFGISYQNALSYAESKRPIVDPNEGFLKQLEEVDKEEGVEFESHDKVIGQIDKGENVAVWCMQQRRLSF
jgi:hypothetical protein